MPILWNLLKYNKGIVFSKVMFNQLTFQVKVLQGVQMTEGLNQKNLLLSSKVK